MIAIKYYSDQLIGFNIIPILIDGITTFLFESNDWNNSY